MRDGNSIKVRSGHKPHKPFKIHSKPHILEVGYFQHPWPHYLGSYGIYNTNMHTGHPTLYSQEWKHANKFNITHWEQGIRLGLPTSTAFIRRQLWLDITALTRYTAVFIRLSGQTAIKIN